MNKDNIIDLIKKYFPEGKEPREEQLETLIKIVEAYTNKKKHFIGQLPTGVGKSYIALTIPKILKEIDDKLKQSVILTKTKALQDQYINEFDELIDIKGKSNYVCSFGTTYSTDVCLKYKKSKKCEPNKMCPYIKRRNYWESTDEERITNMSFFLSYKNAKSDIVVIDECHTLSDELIRYGTLSINQNEIDELKEKALDNGYLDFELVLNEIYKLVSNIKNIIIKEDELKEMIKPLMYEVDEQYNVIKERKDDNTFYNKMFTFYEELKSKLSLFMNSKGDFILKIEEINDGVLKPYKVIEIKPIFANQIAPLAYNKGSFFIHLSATIGDIEVYANENGIKDYDSYETHSPFPIENRKIIYKPLVDFSYKNQEKAIEMTTKLVDKIIEKHKGEMGIIHTSSYHIAYQIREMSKYTNDIYVANNSATIQKYKGKKILIGPTLYEGHDFKDDFARWQILTKIPYASLGDIYIKTKLQIYPKWYQQDAANKIIQSYGRAVRHKEDKAIFYIFDKNFENFRNSKYLPMYVKDAIVKV